MPASDAQTSPCNPQVLRAYGALTQCSFRESRSRSIACALGGLLTCAHACAATAHARRYMNIFISTWVLLVAGLVFALPMIHMRVKETTEESDETL